MVKSVMLVLIFVSVSLMAYSQPKPIIYLNFNDGDVPSKIGDAKVSVSGDTEIVAGGIQGKCIKMNGVDNKIKFQKNFNPKQGTISLWVKATSYTNESKGDEKTVIFDHKTTGENKEVANRILLAQKGGKVYGNFVNEPISTKVVMETGTWYNVAFVWKEGTGLIYVNGAKSGVAAAEGPTAVQKVEFGKYWTGFFDEIKFFDTALTEDEMKDLYENNKGKDDGSAKTSDKKDKKEKKQKKEKKESEE